LVVGQIRPTPRRHFGHNGHQTHLIQATPIHYCSEPVGTYSQLIGSQDLIATSEPVDSACSFAGNVFNGDATLMGECMKSFGIVLGAAALMGISCSASMAQTAEPTYQADPDTYKVIFENADYRVIEAIHKAGVRDKVHGHPVSFVVINLTDCKNRLVGADGKTVENAVKAGTAQVLPAIPSHSAENIGDADCKQIFVEKK
jgi:hypothetical protein